MFNRILNYFRMLGRDPNIIMLGRWNGKNSSKYLEWVIWIIAILNIKINNNILLLII